MRFAFRALQADDEHVFGQPAFGTCLVARDSKRMAFLAEQGVAAIPRAVAHDREFFGEVHDEAAVRIEFADASKQRSKADELSTRESSPCPLERLTDVVARNLESSPARLLDTVFASVHAFGGDEDSDDKTAIVLEIKKLN